jgi:hypothetical protein
MVLFARNDLLDEAAHRLDAERQGQHVDDERVVLLRAREDVRLHRGAEGDDLIRVDVRQRRALEEPLDEAAHERDARRSSDEHDPVERVCADAGVLERSSAGGARCARPPA